MWIQGLFTGDPLRPQVLLTPWPSQVQLDAECGETIWMMSGALSALHSATLQCPVVMCFIKSFIVLHVFLLLMLASSREKTRQTATPAAAPPMPTVTIDPPAPFVVEAGDPGQAVILKVRSTTGKPTAANTDGSLCGIGFRAVPEFGAASQELLNAQTADPRWQEGILAAIRANMTVPAGTPIEHEGLRGMEFQGLSKPGNPESPIRAYLAIFDSPKGRTTLTCVTPSPEFATALPQFRAILATLHPPR